MSLIFPSEVNAFMNRILSIQSACLSLCLLATLGFAFVRVQAEEPGEERFYRITSFEAPEGSVLEAVRKARSPTTPPTYR